MMQIVKLQDRKKAENKQGNGRRKETRIDCDVQLLCLKPARIVSGESHGYGKYFGISRGNGISGNRRQNFPRFSGFESVDKNKQFEREANFSRMCLYFSRKLYIRAACNDTHRSGRISMVLLFCRLPRCFL